MQFDIVTIFPKIFDSYLNESIIKRARKSGKIKINIVNLRDFTNDKHKKARPTEWSFGRVDDKPYGGGAGMVLMAEPIIRALGKFFPDKGRKKNRINKVLKKFLINISHFFEQSF